MIFNHTFKKVLIVSIAWMLAVAASGFVAGVESLRGLLMVSLLAFGPPTVLLHLARELPLTISQTIRRARG